MRLPWPLLRRDSKVHKNSFGHVLIVAGSESMLGAAALTGLAAMRAGAGLVTCAIPRHLNLTLQKKLSPVIMTLPLPQKNPYTVLKKSFDKFNAMAIGPGLGQASGVRALILKLIAESPKPLVIDADALNALAKKPETLLKNKGIKILTPHPGEMARLIGKSRDYVEANRKKAALDFAKTYKSIVLLKGHNTLVVSPEGNVYTNRTGNSGMATAGSGDVLAGMITALVGQGIEAFEAACAAACLHGKAGDMAAKSKTKAAMIATDIIEFIPGAMKYEK
jgi:hydroxyethylthiazole kinase-like uncharacterized protein yjeF